MNSISSSYSQSQGVRLLEAAIQEFGPIFTIDQIYSLHDVQSFTPQKIRTLTSKLAQGGWIEILKNGTYVIKSSLFTESISPFAIASALVHPMAISHWSALSYHGFTTQNVTVIQASTPQKVITPEMRTGQAYRPRGRAVWRAYNLEFEFIYTSENKFWGYESLWVNSWNKINIMDKERTALDLIAHPDSFGGFRAAVELFETAFSEINVQQLIDYALRYNTGTIIKRLGWLLEKLGVENHLLFPLEEYPVRDYVLLDTQQPRSKTNNRRWRINENLS